MTEKGQANCRYHIILTMADPMQTADLIQTGLRINGRQIDQQDSEILTDKGGEALIRHMFPDSFPRAGFILLNEAQEHAHAIHLAEAMGYAWCLAQCQVSRPTFKAEIYRRRPDKRQFRNRCDGEIATF